MHSVAYNRTLNSGAGQNATDSEGVVQTPLAQTDEIWAKRLEYIHYYAISITIVFYLAFQRTAIFFKMCINASRNLHDLLFRGITRSRMEFFNLNSSGRILNRCSNDIGIIDTLLPLALGDSVLVS